jgi:hypothetical protein
MAMSWALRRVEDHQANQAGEPWAQRKHPAAPANRAIAWNSHRLNRTRAPAGAERWADERLPEGFFSEPP